MKVILIPNGEASLIAFKHRAESLQELRPGQAHDTRLLVSANCDGVANSFARRGEESGANGRPVGGPERANNNASCEKKMQPARPI